MLAPGYLWGAQGVSFYAGHPGRVALLPWKHHLPWLFIAAAAVAVAVMAGVQRPGQGEVPAGIRASVPLGGDLIAFWTGARILADDGGPTELYDRPRVLAELSRAFPERPPLYRLAYPPPVYQATSALLPLGYRWAAALQVVAMALLFGLGALAFTESCPTLAKRRLAAWALLAAGPATVMTAVTGQLSGVWFVLLGGAVLAWSRGRRMGAGVLLGLLCAKPTLAAPVALALLIAGQGWALLGFALGGALLLVASLAVGGIGPWWAYLEMMRDTPDLTQRMWLHPARQFTLRTLLALPARGGGLAAPLGWAGVALGLGLCAAVAPRAWRAARHPSTAMLGLGLALSAALLAAPHLFDYDLGFHALGLAAGVVLLLVGEPMRPRLGWFLSIGAYLAPLGYPAARWLGLGAGTLVLLAWVIWLDREVSEITRRRGAETA